MCVCMFKNELPGVGGCVCVRVCGGKQRIVFLTLKNPETVTGPCHSEVQHRPCS